MKDRFRENIEITAPETWSDWAQRGQGNYLAGDLKAALKDFKKALEMNHEAPELYFSAGQVLYDLGKWSEAGDFFEGALKFNKSWAEALLMAGVCREQTGHMEEAANAYRKAIAFDEQMGAAHFNYACLQHAQKNEDLAMDHYQKAYDLSEKKGACALALAKLFQQRKIFNGSRIWYERAIEEHTVSDDNLSNYAVVLQELGCFDKALAMNDEILKREPEHKEARYNRAFCLLVKGMYEKGWKAFEYRNTYVERVEKRWTGEHRHDETLLIAYEQGLGDVIQCARWFPDIKERVGKLYVQCPKSLHKLLGKMNVIDEFYDVGDEVPGVGCQIPVFSIPHALGVKVDDLKGEPYLKVDENKDLGVKKQLRVGLVWAGSNIHGRDYARSCTLEDFEILSELEDVEFVSLQKGASANQLERYRGGLKINNGVADCVDFLDTANVMKGLDLIISVDTSVVHLAGALGKEVWVMVQCSPDWRWFLERNDSPWYNTVRVFRQDKMGNWMHVIRDMKNILTDRLKG